MIGLPPISWFHNWFWLIHLFWFFPLCQDDCFQGWICYYGPTRSSRGLVDVLRNSASKTKKPWNHHIFWPLRFHWSFFPVYLWALLMLPRKPPSSLDRALKSVGIDLRWSFGNFRVTRCGEDWSPVLLCALWSKQLLLMRMILRMEYIICYVRVYNMNIFSYILYTHMKLPNETTCNIFPECVAKGSRL